MKKVLAIILTLTMIFSMVACGGNEAAQTPADNGEPVVIKVGTTTPEDDSFTIGAVKFGELLSERTDGQYSVEVYPNSTLGDERTMIEATQMGTLDGCVCTSAVYVNFIKEFGALDMPFLFPTDEDVHTVIDGDLGREMLDLTEQMNVKGLTFIDKGFRELINSKKEVTTPDDIKGMKVRVMETDIFLASFEALGANVVPMAWTELLTALQQGTVDGFENALNIFVAYQFWDTQKYISLTNHAHSNAIFSLNLDLYNSFPEDIQKIIDECAVEAEAYTYQVVKEQEAEDRATLEDNGMIISDVDAAAFKEKVQSVYDKYPEYAEWVSKIEAAIQ